MKSFVADKNRKLSKLALYHVENLSYSAFLKALRKRDVKVNGKRVSSDVTLSVGDRVEVYFNEQVDNKYREIFSDENVLVLYKKSGYTSESVFESVLCKYSTAKFIHRLDRNTDGIMIFALNESSEKELLDGFKNRTFEKKYQAEVVGTPKNKQDIIEGYLLKDSDSALVKVFDKKVDGSVQIKTGYKVVEIKDQTSVLEVDLYTGKTHQIRAHLAYIGHPIVGDGKYGDFEFNKKHAAKTQRLTATQLTLFFTKNSPLKYLDGKKFTI